MYELLSQATGIYEREVFQGFQPSDGTIAQRMSWASKRTTNRKEDIAYCLLGIFNVKMPLMYREGDYAFIRLQQEIMRVSDDHSLFAWKDSEVMSGSFCGLFARSPKQFKHMVTEISRHDWKPSDVAYHEEYPTPWAMTNLGIEIDLPLIPIDPALPSMYFALLGYGEKKDRPAIIVTRLHNVNFARIHADIFVRHDDPALIQKRTQHLQIEQLVVRQRQPYIRSEFKDGGYFEDSQVTNVGVEHCRSHEGHG